MNRTRNERFRRRPAPRPTALLTALLAALLPLLPSGCRPLYLPLVPESVPSTPALLLDSDAALRLQGDRLRLDLAPRRVPEGGFLAVQWFDPTLREVASQSVWLDASDTPTPLALVSPERLQLRPGRWRALVSFEGQLLQQFTLEVAEGGAG